MAPEGGGDLEEEEGEGGESDLGVFEGGDELVVLVSPEGAFSGDEAIKNSIKIDYMNN